MHFFTLLKPAMMWFKRHLLLGIPEVQSCICIDPRLSEMLSVLLIHQFHRGGQSGTRSKHPEWSGGCLQALCRPGERELLWRESASCRPC